MSATPLLDRPARAAFSFGGLIGDRIAANQRNWLLVAPTANPAMLNMFRDRDRDLPDRNLLLWSGEYAGKYLISAVQGFRLTRDQHLLAELREFVTALIRFQVRDGSHLRDGYLGPLALGLQMIGRDTKHGVKEHAFWDLWGQYHCMLGLYYWYKETGDRTALDSCRRAADLFCRWFIGGTFLETDVAEWRFSREGGPLIAERLKLLPDGRIGGHSHPNEERWNWDNERRQLIFKARNGAESTRFTYDFKDEVFRGVFLFDPTITHLLRQVYFPCTVQNHACAHIFALLYQETGDARYLQLLRMLESAWDKVGGKYVYGFQNGEQFFANDKARRWESLHSVQAIAELYFITGEEKYRRAFQQIWHSIRDRDRHNTGGFSSLEEATGNPYDPRPIETCATIAWMALTLDMLRMTADSRVADELERSTWNATLGAQSPDGRWWTYNTPMGGVPTAGMNAMRLPPPLGGRPPFELGERRPARYDLHFQDTSTRGTSHLSCCAANGPRGLGILSEWAVMIGHDGAISLNYYGPSAFTVRMPSGQDVSLVQETDYPIGGRILLSIFPAAEEQFRLRLRIPDWSRTTNVRLNGVAQSNVTPGAYLTIDRPWRSGDVIELILDMGPHFFPGGPPPPGTDPNGGSTVGMVSVFHGPLLLAYDARLNTHDARRVPPLLQSAPPSPIQWPDNVPRPLLLQQFQTANGSITLCDFASAGFEFQPSPPRRPNPYVGWIFGRGDGSVIAKHIHLERDGRISGYAHPNETYWGFEGDVLVFLTQYHKPSTRFTWVSQHGGLQTLRGVSLFDRRIMHVLSQDETNLWTRSWQFGRVGEADLLAERLLLLDDGGVSGYHNPNEVRWGTEGGRLVFYAQDGRPSTRFNWESIENGHRVLRGVSLFDRSITHVLKELDTSVTGKTWEFSRIGPDGIFTPISAGVQLLSGGGISGHSHPNEARWRFENDVLVFYSANGLASTRFTSIRMQHGRAEWRGQFEFDRRVTHVLRERDPELTDKLWRFVRKQPANPPAAIDIRLLSNNEIDGADHINESRWGVDGGALVFYAANGAISTRYNRTHPGTAPDAFDFRGVPDIEPRTIQEGRFQFVPGIQHELRESNIDLGWTAGSEYVSWLPASESSLGYQIARARFSPQVMSNHLMVITKDGRVFGRQVIGDAIGASGLLPGPPVAANPWDKWVVAITRRVLVIVNDGKVFAHDMLGNSIGVASRLNGPPVAANEKDKCVVVMGDRILVIVNDGKVFAHDVVGNTIGAPIRLNGAPVAANPWDKCVVVMGDRILVIVSDGKVFAHDIYNNTIGVPFQLS
jgi:DUF1680 family protein